MQHRWGCQTPNGEPFNTGDITDCFNDGFYVIMQGEFNRLPELRRMAPGALIMARFYLPNWYDTSAELWAQDIANILNQRNPSDPSNRMNRDLIDCYTWANEQNLAAESGGSIGSSPGNMIKPGSYQIIRDWNLTFLDEIKLYTDCDSVPRAFPALAMGNSDDQDDGAGVGLEILKPVIDRCDYGAIHPYWNADRPIDDEWVGLGRIKKQLPFFKNQLVLVTETGNFAVGRQDAPRQYLDAGYYMQRFGQLAGFAYFIWSDPTKSHQANDMSRNPDIAATLRQSVKTPRPLEMPIRPPDTPDVPEPPSWPDLPPQTTPGKVRIGYQVWQWSAVSTVGTYAHLDRDMTQIGAVVLADKYADSDALMGRFDLAPNGQPDPMAITSIEVMKTRKKWCADTGRIYIPWDVPRAIPVNGDPFEGARREALFHADVCNQVGLEFRISDLEFYPSFFGYSIPRAGIPSVDFFGSMERRNDAAELYYRTFAENSDTRTILQPDPRQWGTIDFGRLTPYLYSIVFQSYAYWFQTLGDNRSHSEIIEDSISKALSLELPSFGLSLYSDMNASGDTPPYLTKQFLDMAVDAKAGLVLVYKAPVDPNKFEVISSMSDPNLIPVTDDIASIKNEAWTEANNAEAIAVKFLNLSARAKAAGYGWMSNGFDGANKALDAASLAAKTATKAPKE